MERFNDGRCKYILDEFAYLNLKVGKSTAAKMEGIFSKAANEIQSMSLKASYPQSSVNHLTHARGIYDQLDAQGDRLGLPLRSS